MADYIKELRKLIGHRPIVLSAAGAIVLDDKNRVLMHYRTDNDTWCLPGGIVDPGETVEETAIREVFEETGLKIYDLKLFNIYSGEEQHYIYPNDDEVYFTNIAFITNKYSGSIIADGVESKDVRFFDIENLPSPISPPVKRHLEDLRKKMREV